MTERWFGRSALGEAAALWRQSLLKHLLTEADKMLLLAAGGAAANADAVYGAVVAFGSVTVGDLHH